LNGLLLSLQFGDIALQVGVRQVLQALLVLADGPGQVALLLQGGALVPQAFGCLFLAFLFLQLGLKSLDVLRQLGVGQLF
jgi:hypothetical protein